MKVEETSWKMNGFRNGSRMDSVNNGSFAFPQYSGLRPSFNDLKDSQISLLLLPKQRSFP